MLQTSTTSMCVINLENEFSFLRLTFNEYVRLIFYFWVGGSVKDYSEQYKTTNPRIEWN